MMNLSINGREFESKHDPVKYIGIRHLCIVGHAQYREPISQICYFIGF